MTNRQILFYKKSINKQICLCFIAHTITADKFYRSSPAKAFPPQFMIHYFFLNPSRVSEYACMFPVHTGGIVVCLNNGFTASEHVVSSADVLLHFRIVAEIHLFVNRVIPDFNIRYLFFRIYKSSAAAFILVPVFCTFPCFSPPCSRTGACDAPLTFIPAGSAARRLTKVFP